MPTCPSDNTVALYMEGTLSAPRASSFRQHIDTCDRCRALVASAARSEGASESERFGVMPGQVLIGKYRVDDFIGSGGMGAVFRGRHVELDLPVAIKAMHVELLGDPAAIRRISREARATAALTSPHTVRVLDIDRAPSGVPFIVMELLEGRDLDRVLREDGVLSFDRVVDIGLQACSALVEAHARGIVHRDLKPSNLILLPDGTVKMVDFGLAKQLSFARRPGESSDSRAQTIIGSPYYMAPEQIRSATNVDARADIWSLGATLYQLLCGARPFNGPNLVVLCSRILTDTFRAIEEKRPDVPIALRDVVVRCLEKAPDARFRSAEELAAALRQANQGPTAEQRPPVPVSAIPTRRSDPADTVPMGPPSHAETARREGAPQEPTTETWPPNADVASRIRVPRRP